MDLSGSDSDNSHSVNVATFEYPSEDEPYDREVYEHGPNLSCKEGMTEGEKVEARRSHNIVSCIGLTSEISSGEIMWIKEYYNLDEKFMCPHRMMRMHRSNILGLRTPRMVITNRLIELSFGCLLH